MARGLLLHWVKLRDTPDGPTIDTYRIVAPTGWNFHPHGALARAIEHMPSDADAVSRRRVDILAAAYDPCVAYSVEYLHGSEEVAHA